jgi:hypothetical protein
MSLLFFDSSALANAMSVEKLTQSVQFAVDQSGQVTAVVVTPDLWKRIHRGVGGCRRPGVGTNAA